MCQTLLEMEELFGILNTSKIAVKDKIPFARFLAFGYMNSSKPAIQTGAIELPHKRLNFFLVCEADSLHRLSEDIFLFCVFISESFGDCWNLLNRNL